MIFPKFCREKKSILRFCRKISAAICLVLVCFTASSLNAAKIEFDVYPGSTTFNVERLNPVGGTAVIEKEQTAVKEVPETKTTPLQDYIEKIITDFPHIFTAPQTTKAISSRPNATIPEVMQPPFSETELTGKGEKELVAVRDGDVKLELLLSTYAPARMEVHLFDVDGSEIWFKGLSLLLWDRPDDKQYAPVQFKGNTDSSSMVLEKAGDYGPNENLSYTFSMKEGQKILLKTGGNAQPRSFIKAKGSAF